MGYEGADHARALVGRYPPKWAQLYSRGIRSIPRQFPNDPQVSSDLARWRLDRRKV
jgi:hypothetical protein